MNVLKGLTKDLFMGGQHKRLEKMGLSNIGFCPEHFSILKTIHTIG